MNSVIRNLSLVSILALGLAACGGDDDASTASAPADSTATAMSEPTSAASSEGEALSMDNIEKAEGVVYQDEIYANWPYN